MTGVQHRRAEAAVEGESTTGPLDAVKLVDVAEAAVRMGVSQMTVRRMYKRGELESVRVSLRSVRIPLVAINAYIAARSNGQSPESV
jgi:excisionase family DNA binding protein